MKRVNANRPAIAQRSDVAPFIVMDVMSAAARIERAGGSVIHMEVGQPASGAPAAAIAAAQAALASGPIAYTEALGIPSLRRRIAAHYDETYGVAVDPERVCVTTGSSGGFLLAFLTMFSAGDRVAVSTPGYPAYYNILQALGVEVVEIETGPATRWGLTGAMVEAAHAERPLNGVLAMSPGNPTGVVMTPEALADLTGTCERLGLWFISDEIYHGLTYERPAETALKFHDDAVIVNSFSKYFCMTGWRIGWLIVPERMIRPVERLTQNFNISVPYLSQVAAEAAFAGKAEMEAVRAGYARSRALLLRELPKIGLGNHLPIDGAFYAFIDVGHLTNDSADFCRRMLEEAGVAATPGLDFDRQRGNRYFRLSFAGSEAEVAACVERLGNWLKT